MYTPAHFAEGDERLITDFIRAHSFALLCIAGADSLPEGVHIPLLLDGSPREGRLLGHVARANPIWQGFDGRPALAVFSGPHGYISPRWYVSDSNVPTWNYSAVHISGRPRLIEDRSALLPYMQRLVAENESLLGDPQWKLDLAEPAYLAALWQGFVLFEMPLESCTAKFKMSQNRRAEDYRGAVDGLKSLGREWADELAALMQSFNAGR